jgi:peptidoglycan hydrolase-like protein with peptidoglycan-binding domain
MRPSTRENELTQARETLQTCGMRAWRALTRHERPGRKQLPVLVVAAIVVLAAVGWIAARQIRSPAQVASDAAPPTASPITVPVESRTLSTTVIVRGTVRYGGRQAVELGTSPLDQGSDLVTKPARLRANLDAGEVALSIDGRPVFVLPGVVSMHRDVHRGSRGPDVQQLEAALADLGHSPGPIDGSFDAATQGAVASFYVARGFEPAGATDTQIEQLRTAQADAAAARDLHLQSVHAAEQAQRGATPGEMAQARIDAAAALDQLQVAELGVPSAETRLATAKTLAEAAKGAPAVAESNSRRDQAAANADVAAKQEAVQAALDEERVAILRRNEVALDAPPSEREAAILAVNTARLAVVRAQAELAASHAAARSVRAGSRAAVQQARAETVNLARRARLAAAELRRARDAVEVARRTVRLQNARVRALARPQEARTLVAIADAAADEARRTRAVVDRLATAAEIRVPADEVVFLPQLPVRVDEVAAKRGSTVDGPVMAVTSSQVVVDSSLSVADSKLVRIGDPVTIEEQELGVSARGKVAVLESTPGTQNVDPNRFFLQVVPTSRLQAAVGASVKLTISVESTGGEVLAVPVSALSVGGDGSSRVQVRRDRTTSVIDVVPGLAAEGYVEIRPTGDERLTKGDLVVVGASARAQASGAGP